MRRKVVFNTNKRDVGGTRQEWLSNGAWAKDVACEVKGKEKFSFKES